MSGQEIGVVIGGSLGKSLEVRLDPGQETALGHYVMAPVGDGASLLGMVVDLSLRAAESGSTSWPPEAGDEPASRLLREVLLDTAVFTQADVQPYLEVASGGAESARARRLPRHFARVALADQPALDAAFAVDEAVPALRLGTPLGMDDVMVHVDLEKLFERSAGVFGKSGTGKSVLTLQLLDAMVANSTEQDAVRDRTVALIFDMHDDYGWGMKFQGGSRQRKSLKERHPSAVAVYTLEQNAVRTDGPIRIGTRDIDPEDLDVLQNTADFTRQAIEVAYECETRFGRDWVDHLLEQDPPEAVVRKAYRDGEEPEEPPSWARIATRLGYASASLDNLRRGLRKIARRQFIQRGSNQFGGVIEHIVQTLQGGKSVVIQFGRDGSDLTSYMLVANMLSRRIWDAYREKMDEARGERAKEPNRLVIVIEEAHKFVDKAVAGQTIFGQIARELRKYNVTLLVIDQRPSQIDSEVLSQIGTKVCFQLDSDADVEALVGGVARGGGLRTIIGSLQSQRQALVFGHALPMPVVIQPPELTADYGAGASLRGRLGAGEPAIDGATAPVRGLFG